MKSQRSDFWLVALAGLCLGLACSSLPPESAPQVQPTCTELIEVNPIALKIQTELTSKTATVPPSVRVISVTKNQDTTKIHYETNVNGQYTGGFVSWAAKSGSQTALQAIDVVTLCRGGPLPTVGEDVVACDHVHCSRVGPGGLVWTSVEISRASNYALDSHVIHGNRVLVVAPEFLKSPQQDGTYEYVENPVSVIALDAQDGVFQQSWPPPPILSASKSMVRRIVDLDNETALALGVVTREQPDPNYPLASWTGIMNKDGTWSSIHVFDDEVGALDPIVHDVKRTPAGEYLVLFSEYDPSFMPSMVTSTWLQQNFILRLDKSWKTLAKSKFPGNMPGDWTPTSLCPGNWDMTNVRLDALADGRYVVMRTSVSAVGTTATVSAPFPIGGIYGEGFFLDAFGNHLGSFQLPAYQSDPPWRFDLNGLEPLLVSSSTCGLSVLWDNAVYQLSLWGHKTVEEAGKCAELTYADCQDTDPCTNDLCDPKLGCVHPTFADGAACSVQGVCKAGVCVEP